MTRTGRTDDLLNGPAPIHIIGERNVYLLVNVMYVYIYVWAHIELRAHITVVLDLY